jgi:hypoxanthine phosphoribosyltransferase
MPKVYPVIFSYYSKYPKKVQSDYKSFFYSICKEVGIDVKIEDVEMGDFLVPTLLDLPQTVDIEQLDQHIAAYARILSTTLQNKLADKDIIEENSSLGLYGFKQDSPHLILYFQSSIAIPPKSLANLFLFLRQLLANSGKYSLLNKKVIVVLPTDLPSRNEFVYSNNIEDECEKGQVILLDKNGDSVNRDTNLEKLFLVYKDILKDDPLKLLEAKLIGRVGHFQREYKDGGKIVKSCHLFFYDGGKCITEVEDLLRQKMKKVFKHIVYHCPVSPWLESAIQNLKLSLSEGLDIYNILDKNDIERIVNLQHGLPVLFVVDLIHTGNNFMTQLNRIKKLNPDLKVENVSILYSGPKEDGNRKEVTIDHNLVSYFLHVKQQTFQQGACEMCKTYHIPPDYINVENQYARLQTYFYWKLSEIYDYLYDSENDTPSYRSSIKVIPKFKDLLADCSPYIASKIINYFEQDENLNPANSYTFICPDEEAIALIGKSLEYLADISVILIPKAVTQLITDQTFEKDKVIELYKDEEWLRALIHFETKSPNKSVFIIDEFTVTGEKLRLLAKLVEYFSLQVAGYFPFILYNESLSLSESEKVHSLYSFNLHLSNPI